MFISTKLVWYDGLHEYRHHPRSVDIHTHIDTHIYYTSLCLFTRATFSILPFFPRAQPSLIRKETSRYYSTSLISLDRKRLGPEMPGLLFFHAQLTHLSTLVTSASSCGGDKRRCMRDSKRPSSWASMRPSHDTSKSRNTWHSFSWSINDHTSEYVGNAYNNIRHR